MIEPPKIQVRFTDLDLIGHVNNSVYLSYFEYARVYYFNKILGEDWDWNIQSCLVVRNEINYHKSIFLNDEPTVYLFLDEMGSKSFTVSYEIRVENNVTTTGKTTLVCFDRKSNKTVELSNVWREALNRLIK